MLMTVARVTGWPEREILWEIPLARLVQSALDGGATQAVDADGQALAAPVAALLAQGVGGVGTGAAA